MGLNRLTANFAQARVDGAFKASDRETVEMAHFLMRRDGLFLGEQSVLQCSYAYSVTISLFCI
eukprot:scaffold662800_cov81-Prasinocladus_malaysianus.AAC.1